MSASTLEIKNQSTATTSSQGPDSRVAAPHVSRARAVPARRSSPLGTLGFLIAAGLLVFGLTFPLRRYVVPVRGLGYALGITGASMMMLLFVYSARKRLKWLRFLGPTSRWFRVHMFFGVLGPLCILYHCDFTLGATNSNVALVSMLTVAGSGLIGRYLYAHIHRGLYGQRLSLAELREQAEQLRPLPGHIEFLPGLVGRLETIEQRLLAAGSGLPMLAAVKPPFITAVALISRLQIHHYIRRQIRRAASPTAHLGAERLRVTQDACAYADRRIGAVRRLAAFQAYERLFSLWHVLHLPLVFVLVAAAIVHVVAASLY